MQVRHVCTDVSGALASVGGFGCPCSFQSEDMHGMRCGQVLQITCGLPVLLSRGV